MQENNNQAEPQKAISNGRNKRRCSNKVSNTAPQAPVCGLIEDISVFSEKLSGQHNKGYVDNTEKPEVTTVESQASSAENQAEESAKQTETTCECTKEETCECSQETTCECSQETEKTECAKNSKKEKYTGPSFEETKNTQKRALEVSLKKVPHKSEKVVEKDAVSYSKVSASMNDKPEKRGVLSKIKSLFSKLFGKKHKKNSRNFKNNKGGYRKNYSKGKKNFDKNGNFDKNKEGGSYRPNNRRKNYNRRPNSCNKTKAPVANKE